MKKPSRLCDALILLASINYVTAAAPESVMQLSRRDESMRSIYAVCIVSTETLFDEPGVPAEIVRYEQRYTWLKKENREKNTVEYTLVPAQFRKPIFPDPNNTKQVRIIATERRIQAFDGENTKWLTPERKEGGVYREPYSMHVTPARWLLPEVTNMSLSDYLRKEDTTVKYLGLAGNDQQKLHCLEFSDKSLTGKVYIRDFDGSPVPMRYECQLGNTELRYEADHFEKFGSVTLPTSVVFEAYRILPDKKKLLDRETVKVEKLIVNEEIPARDLQIQFPSGTRVTDMRSHKLYIVAEDGTWREPFAGRKQRLIEPLK
ncbi:MAG: hypothetical protein LLF76_09630 [Planctomycetaceae bacterium]|nr:hypothetical protein [Planctomycetaceae bacterium]